MIAVASQGATALVGATAAGRSSRRRSRPPVTILVAFGLLAVAAACALLPGLAPQDAARIDAANSLLPPSGEHLLGTDQLGRDVLSRIVAGARSALIGPLLLATASVIIAAALALTAGYFGGIVDTVVSRLVDVLYSVPAVIVAIVVVGVVGGGFWVALAVLLVFGLPQSVRVFRAAVLERVQLPYIEAAQTLGVPSSRIVLRHLLPNLMPLVVAGFFLKFTYGIVDFSSLSYLGLGVPPGSADWGRMLSENRTALADNAWAAAGPGLALVAVAVSMNLVGDWMFARYERAGRSR